MRQSSQLFESFAGAHTKVFRPRDLGRFLHEHRHQWPSGYRTATQVAQWLLDGSPLRVLRIDNEVHPTPQHRYTWGPVAPLAVALSLMSPRAYFSHGTAAELHSLTTRPPETLVANEEQTAKPPIQGKLNQDAVARAFVNPQRVSRNVYRWQGGALMMLNGKFTGRRAVTTVDVQGLALPVTTLDRTLIDLAVRPSYGGGVDGVLEAYRKARERVDVLGVTTVLEDLDYIYPYHQAIGFYFSRSGVDISLLAPLRALPFEIDFYLTHEMKDPNYDSDWRIYYPNHLGA
jgi:hypothetical protein